MGPRRVNGFVVILNEIEIVEFEVESRARPKRVTLARLRGKLARAFPLLLRENGELHVAERPFDFRVGSLRAIPCAPNRSEVAVLPLGPSSAREKRLGFPHVFRARQFARTPRMTLRVKRPVADRGPREPHVQHSRTGTIPAIGVGSRRSHEVRFGSRFVASLRERVRDGFELLGCLRVKFIVAKALRPFSALAQADVPQRALQQCFGPTPYGRTRRPGDDLRWRDRDLIRADVPDVGALLSHGAGWAKRSRHPLSARP